MHPAQPATEMRSPGRDGPAGHIVGGVTRLEGNVGRCDWVPSAALIPPERAGTRTPSASDTQTAALTAGSNRGEENHAAGGRRTVEPASIWPLFGVSAVILGAPVGKDSSLRNVRGIVELPAIKPTSSSTVVDVVDEMNAHGKDILVVAIARSNG